VSASLAEATESSVVRRVATDLAAALAVACALAAAGSSAAPSSHAAVSAQAATSPRVIHVTARRFEYDPSVIRVRPGEPVVLELEAVDRKHGFSIPDLHIRADVDPGRTERLALPGVAAGTYAFGCDVFCGSHHEEMAGALVVE
jgi:cytochrome c oxidase subunit 2